MTGQGQIIDEAIRWHLRLADASEQEWRDHILWLEASPEHAAAYDRVATDDLLVDRVGAPGAAPGGTILAANDAVPPRRRGLRVALAGGGLALATTLTALLAIPAPPPAADQRYMIATAPGEHRAVRLADGTLIEVDGGTRLTLDRANPRFAALAGGQALFHVRHDAAAPFELHAGGAVLRDMGTVFQATRDEGRLDVQVAEGAVMFRPDREAVTLRPGMSLAARDGDDRIVLGRVPPAEVGTWRMGRLTFRNVSLRAVARAIERSGGARLEVAESLAERPFTGTVRVTGEAARDVSHLAALAGVAYRRSSPGWMITP